jgi:hypothetical protein
LFTEGCQGLPVAIPYLVIFHQLIFTENNETQAINSDTYRMLWPVQWAAAITSDI